MKQKLKQRITDPFLGSLVDSLDCPHNAESVSILWRQRVKNHLHSVIMT